MEQTFTKFIKSLFERLMRIESNQNKLLNQIKNMGTSIDRLNTDETALTAEIATVADYVATQNAAVGVLQATIASMPNTDAVIVALANQVEANLSALTAIIPAVTPPTAGS